MKPNLLGKKIAFYILIIVVWQGIDSADIWPDNIFPSPIEVGEDLLFGISDGSLFYGIATSMWRLIVGLAIAIGGGMLLGIFMARAAFPYMITGFKQGWAFAWRGVIGAELLFSFLGLGFLLNVGRQLNDVSQVIAMMLVIMGIGILIDGFVFKKIEDKVMTKWGLR